MNHKFRITFDDPTSGEEQVEEREFEDTGRITAREWADDWAYSAAYKGHYEIEEITNE